MSINLSSKCPIMVQILVQADYWTFTGMTLLFSQYLEISFCKSSCSHKNSYTRCVSNFLDGWEGSNYYLQKTGNDTKVRFLVCVFDWKSFCYFLRDRSKVLRFGSSALGERHFPEKWTGMFFRRLSENFLVKHLLAIFWCTYQ